MCALGIHAHVFLTADNDSLSMFEPELKLRRVLLSAFFRMGELGRIAQSAVISGAALYYIAVIDWSRAIRCL
jgi:hypothetical protein